MDESTAAGGQQSHVPTPGNDEDERFTGDESNYGTLARGRGHESRSGSQQPSGLQSRPDYASTSRISSYPPDPQSTPSPRAFPQAAGQASNQYNLSQTNPLPTAFNMSAMAGALPDHATLTRQALEQQQPSRYHVGHTSPAHMYQMQPQQISPSFPASQLYQGFQQSTPYQYQQLPNVPHMYPPMMASPQAYAAGSRQSPAGYSPSWVSPAHSSYMYYTQNPGQVEYQDQQGGPGNSTLVSHSHGARSGPTMESYDPDFSGMGPASSVTNRGLNSRSVPAISSAPSRTLQLSIPRGPPRKPKQSGNALWVGNLPPGTNVVDLKDHFSKDARQDIESVFLISKSNCAFVNYRTGTSCAAAMNRFHDSRFNGVRLVCRLRRNAASPSTGATPSSAQSPSGSLAPLSAPPKHSSAPNVTEASSIPLEAKGKESGRDRDQSEKLSDRYFVVKSLTVEDLELSIRNGIWATQAHNEAALNQAFEESENVYLIFSANKSGEYFGYARMTSAIQDDPSMQNEWTPQTISPESADLPKAIPTTATVTAPKGRIIDDSSRGTIFWEAENELEPEVEHENEGDEASGKSGDGENQEESITFEKAWGKPFRVEWLSTNRLPFFRTRGLRNSWNANREVKIARDGTELETSVGRRLLETFHRPAQYSNTAPSVPTGRPMLSSHPAQQAPIP